MNFYTPENPPKHGTARKIWRTLTAEGFTILDLHYNPNLWGRGESLGWGTWAVQFNGGSDKHPGLHVPREGCHAGIHNGLVYLREMTGSYSAYFIGPVKTKGTK